MRTKRFFSSSTFVAAAISLFLLTLLPPAVVAEPRLPHLFTDHMVLHVLLKNHVIGEKMGKPRLRHHSRREESQQEKRNGRRDEGRVGEKSFLPHLVEISSPSSEPQSDNREYARFSTPAPSPSAVLRSEERRVGKECRSGGSAYQ